MALKRIWRPSGNYSGGSRKRLLVIHTMEGFTGPNGANDCAVYFQGNVGASSQVCIDNNAGTVWEGVTRANSAWTQCNYNSVSISCEQSGYASWSRQYWLDNREPQLRNIAAWLAEESAATGIPLVDISSSAAQGSGTGVCYHSELGSAGCGHSDPGAGFPLDQVLAWAKGSTTAPPEEDMALSDDDIRKIGEKVWRWEVNSGHQQAWTALDKAANAAPPDSDIERVWRWPITSEPPLQAYQVLRALYEDIGAATAASNAALTETVAELAETVAALAAKIDSRKP